MQQARCGKQRAVLCRPPCDALRLFQLHDTLDVF